MVGGNAGLIGMSKEHLSIALALSVPVVVCITKVILSFLHWILKVDGQIEIDMTPPNVLAETVKQVVKILKSPGCRSVLSKLPSYSKAHSIALRKIPVFVKSLETAVELASLFGTEKLVNYTMIRTISPKLYTGSVRYSRYRTLQGKAWTL